MRPSLGILLVAGLLLRAAIPANAGTPYFESFEQDFGGWTPGHYLECEGATPACTPLNWSITRSTDQAQQGTHSLRSFLNGEHDDGTVWVERCFLVVSPSPLLFVSLRVQLWSQWPSDFNRWPVVAYAGALPPETESDFAIIGEDGAAAGWTEYFYLDSVPAVGRLWIAFGVSATWETTRTHYLDSVELSFFPGELLPSAPPVEPLLC